MLLKNVSPQEYRDLVPEGVILLGYRGSIAHGTYSNPEHFEDSIDDKDIMGVAIPGPDYYFGLNQFGSRGTHEKKLREWDSVVYEIRKFVSLLYQSNPNVLSLLWLEPHHYILRTEWGDRLVEARTLFVSKKIYYAFSGYAYGQLKRMTHYHTEGYMGQKRKELVDRYGFDCKNASHLIRILRMGTEFLREGCLHVHRHDARELVAIKTGEWPLEKVKEEAGNLFKRAEQAYDECKFPNEPDREAVNSLLVNILSDYFGTVKSSPSVLRDRYLVEL
jgi:uncharacterized protein